MGYYDQHCLGCHGRIRILHLILSGNATARMGPEHVLYLPTLESLPPAAEVQMGV